MSKKKAVWNLFLDYFLNGNFDDDKERVFTLAKQDCGNGKSIDYCDLPYLFWLFIEMKKFSEMIDHGDAFAKHKNKFLAKLGAIFYNVHENMHERWIEDSEISAFFKNSCYVGKRRNQIRFIELNCNQKTSISEAILIIIREHNELAEYIKCRNNKKIAIMFENYGNLICSEQRIGSVVNQVMQVFEQWRDNIQMISEACFYGSKSKRMFSPAVLNIDYCQLCGRKVNSMKQSEMLASHHLIPLSEGGVDDPKNLIVLCPRCHNEVHRRRNMIKEMEKKEYASS